MADRVMDRGDAEDIMEMIFDLVIFIDADRFDEQPVVDRLTAIERALFRAAGIPRPDLPTPGSPPDEVPAA